MQLYVKVLEGTLQHRPLGRSKLVHILHVLSSHLRSFAHLHALFVANTCNSRALTCFAPFCPLARGIKGVEKNGNSDGMVELWVGKDKKNPLKTKVFDDSTSPQVRLASLCESPCLAYPRSRSGIGSHRGLWRCCKRENSWDTALTMKTDPFYFGVWILVRSDVTRFGLPPLRSAA